MRIAPDGSAGPIEVIAERADAELDGFEVNEQGTLAALIWNAGGRSELAFVDLPSGRTTKGPELPAELAGGLDFSADGAQLAMTISGRPRLLTCGFSPGDEAATPGPHSPMLVSTSRSSRGALFGALHGTRRPRIERLAVPAEGTHCPRTILVQLHGGPKDRNGRRSEAITRPGSCRVGVFAPNVRGSSGFGKKFVNLDNVRSSSTVSRTSRRESSSWCRNGSRIPSA